MLMPKFYFTIIAYFIAFTYSDNDAYRQETDTFTRHKHTLPWQFRVPFLCIKYNFLLLNQELNQYFNR